MTAAGFTAFQLACVGVLAIAYGLYLREAERRGDAVRDALLIVVSAWIGEQTCISRYEMYAYADGWSLFLGDVPLLVPLIWPMVILSARSVMRQLWPDDSRLQRAVRVALAVVIDASLMEVVAVAAGLWRWSEGGYLGVPIIGVLGWGCFGFAASWWLDRAETQRNAAWALPIVGVAATHVMLVALWWGGFRWGLRDDLPPLSAVIGFAVLMLVPTVLAYRVRAARRLSWNTTASRIAAASVFFALLAAMSGPGVPYLWAHVGVVAIPYLLVTPFGSRPTR